MQHRELFRWAFSGSGLWLMLSPYLLLGGQSSFGTDVVGEAMTLVIMGFLALIAASLSFSSYIRLRVYFGLTLGLAIIGVPQIAGFTEAIATWNAVLVGAGLVFVALLEVFQKAPQLTTIKNKCGAPNAPHASKAFPSHHFLHSAFSF
ncbi:MAG: hypothetical protein ACJAY6_002970 [Yoonia sp.]|jgi:hypothetical protein